MFLIFWYYKKNAAIKTCELNSLCFFEIGSWSEIIVSNIHTYVIEMNITYALHNFAFKPAMYDSIYFPTALETNFDIFPFLICEKWQLIMVSICICFIKSTFLYNKGPFDFLFFFNVLFFLWITCLYLLSIFQKDFSTVRNSLYMIYSVKWLPWSLEIVGNTFAEFSSLPPPHLHCEGNSLVAEKGSTHLENIHTIKTHWLFILSGSLMKSS